MNKYVELRRTLRVRTVYFQHMTITLFNEKELQQAQRGYDENWSKSWFVIGEEELCGDPIFVDLADAKLPVYTIAHDISDWAPERLANSFEAFLELSGNKLTKHN